MRNSKRCYRHAFTLIELIVVITIILLVSVLVIPTAISSLREHPMVSAAQLLQASIVQARDSAVASGTPRGIRLVPDGPISRLADGTIDPAVHLVCSKIVPIAVPPAYQEGRVSIIPATVYPAALTGGRPCLVLEQSPGRFEGNTWLPNSPTSWAWNVRLGERVAIGAGGEYTVCGPMIEANPDQFVNYGPPGSPGLPRTYTAPDGTTVDVEVEVLLLVNGEDDDRDGHTDDGWDGLDNDGINGVDDLAEWEAESWIGQQSATTTDAAYRVIRRPVPAQGQQPIDLPNPAVIDLTTGRSTAVIDRFSGAVDLLIGLDGSFAYDLPYSGASSLGMDRSSYVHLWIGSRGDISEPTSPMPPPKEDARLLTISKAGLVSVLQVNPDDPGRVFLDARRGQR